VLGKEVRNVTQFAIDGRWITDHADAQTVE